MFKQFLLNSVSWRGQATLAPPNDPPGDPDETLEDDFGEEGQDAGHDDDEGGDEASGQEGDEAEGEEGQVEPPKPSRATKAVNEAKRVAREAAAEAANLRKEIEALKQQRQQAAPQEETPEQEQAKLALMSVEERVDYKLAKAEKVNQRQLAMYQFQAAEAADKAAFDAKAAYEPRYKRYAADVEKLLASERQLGKNWPRETVLKFVLGERVLNSKPAVDKARKDGERRVNSQRTSSESGRSDRAAPRGRGTGNTLSDLERRLEGVNI